MCRRSDSARRISSTKAVRAAATGCDAILHHAGRKSVARSILEPEAFVDVNVRGTLNVLLAARDERAITVFASSSSAYGDRDEFPLHEELEPRPRSPYAATKIAGKPSSGRGGDPTVFRPSR